VGLLTSCAIPPSPTLSVGRYDVVAELSRGQSMRRVVRPDFVPSLTVEAAHKDTAVKDNDDTDSEQSYRYEFPSN
jgi:hypothetical protein